MNRAMRNVWDSCRDLVTCDAGQDLVEYALLALLLGVGALTAIPPLSIILANLFNSVVPGL